MSTPVEHTPPPETPMTSTIPTPTKRSLERYVDSRIPTGRFLGAVLENNLAEAFARADSANLGRLHDIVLWVCGEAPAESHGSPEAVREWLRGRTKT